MANKTEVKSAPNSKDSEMLVLGCMLTNNHNLLIGADELNESDFYYAEHMAIFQALKTLQKQGKPADVSLLCEELKRQDKLQSVGGLQYIISLAQYAGTSAYIQEYIDTLKNKSLLRTLIVESQYIGKEALEDNENPLSLIERLQNTLRLLEHKHGKRLPIIKIEDRIGQFEELLQKYRGEKYLGLRVKSIEEFNEHLLGLRKLNLLAAAPNVGKTALTIQLGLEALLMEENACLAYFSLEMTSLEIFTRINLYLSELNFRTFMFGSQQQSREKNPDAYFTSEEQKKIKNSYETLKRIGDRIQIIDTSTCPFIDAKSVINYVNALKEKTQCTRAIVIIDYLQVWPINPSIRFPSENEADKWRIGEMKKIRDSMGEDPVIVISEARKPSGKDDTWGGDLSDVMGSARGTYTPDIVMLLSQLKPKALAKFWTKNNMPKIEFEEEIECSEDEKAGLAIKNYLSKLGICICKLEVPKARDGMQKFSIMLEYHFQRNLFRKVNWESLKKNDKAQVKSYLNFND